MEGIYHSVLDNGLACFELFEDLLVFLLQQCVDLQQLTCSLKGRVLDSMYVMDSNSKESLHISQMFKSYFEQKYKDQFNSGNLGKNNNHAQICIN